MRGQQQRDRGADLEHHGSAARDSMGRLSHLGAPGAAGGRPGERDDVRRALQQEPEERHTFCRRLRALWSHLLRRCLGLDFVPHLVCACDDNVLRRWAVKRAAAPAHAAAEALSDLRGGHRGAVCAVTSYVPFARGGEKQIGAPRAGSNLSARARGPGACRPERRPTRCRPDRP